MAPPTSNDHYIGFRVSLTSKSAIRYIGTLCSIDTKLSTVALKNVRSFGTEGRLRDGGPVMPSECIYPYIIFRASDILDLQVLSKPPAPDNPCPSTSGFSSSLLPNAPISYPPATTSLALPLTEKPSESVPNMTAGAPSYFSSARPSVQLASNNLEGLPVPTPWTYDGFDSFDLGLTKSYTGEPSDATMELPKTSKFAPLYPPTTAMMLPPYGTDRKKIEGNVTRKLAVPGADPFRNDSSFDVNLSQGFGSIGHISLGNLNPSPAAASNSGRPVHSTGLSERADAAKQGKVELRNPDELRKASSSENIRDETNTKKAIMRRGMQQSMPNQHPASRTKVESAPDSIHTESGKAVKAPVPRAWGPPPVAATQVHHSDKNSPPPRSGNNTRREIPESAKPSSEQLSNSRPLGPNKGIVPSTSNRLRGGSYDRARRGGRRGRWDYASRRKEGRLIDVPNEDFNFEEMHEKLAAIQQEGTEYPPVDPRYDKSKSFFDNLVPEKDVRAETSVSQQRAKDVETFGEAGAKAHNRRCGGGRNGHHPYRGRPARARARARARGRGR